MKGKPRLIIGVFLIFLFGGLGVYNFMDTMTPYVSFAEAKTAGRTVQVAGFPDHRGAGLDVEAGMFTFTMKDDSGEHSLNAYLDRLFGLELEDKLVITGIREGGPAARAGCAIGDRITAVWGEPVSSATEMFGPWRDHAEDPTIVYHVQRSAEELVLKAPKKAAADDKPKK